MVKILETKKVVKDPNFYTLNQSPSPFRIAIENATIDGLMTMIQDVINHTHEDISIDDLDSKLMYTELNKVKKPVMEALTNILKDYITDL